MSDLVVEPALAIETLFKRRISQHLRRDTQRTECLNQPSVAIEILESGSAIRFASPDLMVERIIAKTGGKLFHTSARRVTAIDSYLDRSTEHIPDVVFLSGEIRAVSRIEQRIAEAARLGFREMYISKYNSKGIDFGKYNIRVYTLGKVEELKSALFV